MTSAPETRQPTISLCMIVKNEEEFLGPCLDSVKDAVDEIIIVDTGSTDRTLEIAQRYGAKVFLHPWENDFSKHRNQSLSYATGDWILIMDADETVFPEDVHLIRETVVRGDADHYHCIFHDMRPDGSVHGIFSQIRLFHNGMGMRYTYAVHNQLEWKGRKGVAPVRIRHFGYHGLTPEKREAKHERTTSLLFEAIRKEPDNPYYYFQLSSSFSMHLDYEEAAKYGEQALTLRRAGDLQFDYFLINYYTVAHAYICLHNLDRAEAICREALDYVAFNPDIHYLLYEIYVQRKDWSRAMEAGWRYLSIRDDMTANLDKLIGSYWISLERHLDALKGMAGIALQENDEAVLETLLRRIFEASADRAAVARNHVAHYVKREDWERAAFWLAKAYEAGERSGEFVAGLKDHLEQTLGVQSACEHLTLLAAGLPDWPGLWEILGELQARTGHAGEAIAMLLKVIAAGEASRDTHLLLGRLLAAAGEHDKALTIYERLSALLPEDGEAHLRALRLCLDLNRMENALPHMDALSGIGLTGNLLMELRLAIIDLSLRVGDADGLVPQLEAILKDLSMETHITLDTVRDLENLLYAVAEKLDAMGDSQSADYALRLARALAPADTPSA